MSPIYTPQKTHSPVNFKCYNRFTGVEVGGKKCTVNNYSGFMRDFPTLKFTEEYAIKNFPEGTNIAEFGCSTGQKTYSLMMLLDKNNKNKKYKFTGYDFPEVIKKTNLKLYTIDKDSPFEQVLFNDYNENNIYEYKDVSNKQAKEIQEAFNKYFEKYTPSTNTENKSLSELKERIENAKNPERKLQAKKDYVFAKLKKEQKDVYTTKSNINDSLIKFLPGDIRNIDKHLEKGKSGIIIFQNALYHVLSGGLGYRKKEMTNIADAEILLKKISDVLPKNGIFVIGNLSSDHVFDESDVKDSHLKYQNDKIIRVFDSSPVHKALYANGMEPVFYEKVSDKTNVGLREDIWLPSVWKKK